MKEIQDIDKEKRTDYMGKIIDLIRVGYLPMNFLT